MHTAEVRLQLAGPERQAAADPYRSAWTAFLARRSKLWARVAAEMDTRGLSVRDVEAAFVVAWHHRQRPAVRFQGLPRAHSDRGSTARPNVAPLFAQQRQVRKMVADAQSPRSQSDANVRGGCREDPAGLRCLLQRRSFARQDGYT